MGGMSPRQAVSRLARRVGHRGSYLLLLAVLGLGFGWSLLSEPPTLFHQLDIFVDVHVWAVAWIAMGVICGVSAFAKRDRAGFTAGAGMIFLWGGANVEGWLFHHLFRGWVSVIIWFTFAVVTLVVASWPEPAPEGWQPSPPKIPPA